MANPVIMPRQGQSVESCILTEWKVQPGDTVAEGDVLAVIETDKASFDLESTASGTVLELFWEADDDVPVLANVIAIGAEGENIDDLEEERRLFYVAMTRAMDILCLTYAKKRSIYGKSFKRQRSFFIDDIEKRMTQFEKSPVFLSVNKKEKQLELF